MKYLTTKKFITENNLLIIGFGYCEIAGVEQYLRANAYTAGNNGWGCDVYDMGGFAITCGYSPVNFAMNEKYKTVGETVRQKILALDAELQAEIKPEWARNWADGRKHIIDTINAAYTDALNEGV